MLLFQYPEGFWPDSDTMNDMNSITITGRVFQYPEGFWPDSDSLKLGSATSDWKGSFSTPKGFGPIVTNMAPQHPEIQPEMEGRGFSTPKGFGPIVTNDCLGNAHVP